MTSIDVSNDQSKSGFSLQNTGVVVLEVSVLGFYRTHGGRRL